MTLQINADQTNVTINVAIKDTSDGGVTGLVFDSADLTCYYVRPGAAAVQLALITQTITGAHHGALWPARLQWLKTVTVTLWPILFLACL